MKQSELASSQILSDLTVNTVNDSSIKRPHCPSSSKEEKRSKLVAPEDDDSSEEELFSYPVCSYSESSQSDSEDDKRMPSASKAHKRPPSARKEALNLASKRANEKEDVAVNDGGEQQNPTPDGMISQGIKQHGRKRRFPQSRSERKQNRNSNKAFFTARGTQVQPREFVDYTCKCLANCHEKVSVAVRKEAFNKFWELGSYDAQTGFISDCVNEFAPKRKYNKKSTMKLFSRRYELGSTAVCRDMFIKTLGISTKRVNTALCKTRTSSVGDQRGIAGGHNKLPSEKQQVVVDHINKFPRYISHLRRGETGNGFLEGSLTLRKMYDLYYAENEDQPVSFSKYSQIFYSDLKLKFRKWKKDVCGTCVSTMVKCAKASNADEKALLKVQYDLHLAMAEEAQIKLLTDMKRAMEDGSVETLTFDLEKAWPLPRIPTDATFYKRRLWLYHCRIQSGKARKCYHYVWGEGDAGRGAQEVGSCLKRHAQSHLTTDVKTLVLWAHPCGGQNRNVKIMLILKAILQSHPALEAIHLLYLNARHGFLPNDSDFGSIEAAIKLCHRLYTPNDYVDVMRTCRKGSSLEVLQMKSQDFVGTRLVEELVEVDDKKEIDWPNVHEVKVMRDAPYVIFVKTSHQQEEFEEIHIHSHSKERSPTSLIFLSSLAPLWPKGKPISTAKFNDLQAMMNTIPSDAKHVYEGLTADNEVTDDVDGFDGPLDFDVEVEAE